MKITHVVTKHGAVLHVVGARANVRKSWLNAMAWGDDENGQYVWDFEIRAADGTSVPMTMPTDQIIAIGDDHEHTDPDNPHTHNPSVPVGSTTGITTSGVTVEL